MKVGDKLLCKASKWEVIDWDNDGKEIYGYSIIEGKYYFVEEKIIKMDSYNPRWGITSELDVLFDQVFSEEELSRYFYTEKEVRKLKLDEIKKG